MTNEDAYGFLIYFIIGAIVTSIFYIIETVKLGIKKSKNPDAKLDCAGIEFMVFILWPVFIFFGIAIVFICSADKIREYISDKIAQALVESEEK